MMVCLTGSDQIKITSEVPTTGWAQIVHMNMWYREVTNFFVFSVSVEQLVSIKKLMIWPHI